MKTTPEETSCELPAEVQRTATGEEEGNHYKTVIRKLRNIVAEKDAELLAAAEREREAIRELTAQQSTEH